MSDKAGAKLQLIRLSDALTTLKIMWAGTGYNGAPLARYARAVAAITVEVVARASPHSFQVLRRRWVIERTFGRLMRYRRLARACERTTANSEAMIYWATTLIMTRRLARYQAGQAPEPRWGGGQRPRPRLPPRYRWTSVLANNIRSNLRKITSTYGEPDELRGPCWRP